MGTETSFHLCKKCLSTAAVDYQLLLTLASVFRLLTKEDGILEPSKILNKEQYLWITKNLLL